MCATRTCVTKRYVVVKRQVNNTMLVTMIYSILVWRWIAKTSTRYGTGLHNCPIYGTGQCPSYGFTCVQDNCAIYNTMLQNRRMYVGNIYYFIANKNEFVKFWYNTPYVFWQPVLERSMSHYRIIYDVFGY
jgi:hypothetical protein